MNLRPVLLLILTGLAACSNSSSSSSGPATDGGIGTALPAQLISFEAMNIKPLVCGSPRGCAPPVGQLVVQTMSGPNFCTVSLVAPDVVLTASHCAPWLNARPDRTITGNCWIRWPATKGRPETRVACASIVKTSELVAGDTPIVQADWAFIRLATPQLDRVPFRIRDEDAFAGARKTSVVLFGISVAGDKHTIRREHCARNDAFTMPQRKALPGETIIMPSCRIEKGFSGGPILDPASAEVIGVVSFMRNPPPDPRRNEKPGLAVGTDAPDLPR